MLSFFFNAGETGKQIFFCHPTNCGVKFNIVEINSQQYSIYGDNFLIKYIKWK